MLRPYRILIVSEFPSYDSLQNVSGDCFLGHTRQVLNRAFQYLNLDPVHFSYAPIVRCWRDLNHQVTADSYKICRDYIKTFVSATQAPAVITLGSMVSKYSYKDELLYDEKGKFRGNDYLRRSWTRTPHDTHFGTLGVPTEHPQAVRLIQCNSQVLFRAICVDIMRAVGYAAQKNEYYDYLSKDMRVEIYLRDYEKIIEKTKEFLEKSRTISSALKTTPEGRKHGI